MDRCITDYFYAYYSLYNCLYFNEEYLDKAYSLMDNINELVNSNIEDYSNDENSESSNEVNVTSKLINSLSESETVSDIDNSKEDEINETFINPYEEIKNMKLNKTRLRNLKKIEIFKIIQKLNLNITENSTKKVMIDGIVPYI